MVYILSINYGIYNSLYHKTLQDIAKSSKTQKCYFLVTFQFKKSGKTKTNENDRKKTKINESQKKDRKVTRPVDAWTTPGGPKMAPFCIIK
jgi:hypothetical protein